MKTLKTHLSPDALKSKDLFSCHSEKKRLKKIAWGSHDIF